MEAVLPDFVSLSQDVWRLYTLCRQSPDAFVVSISLDLAVLHTGLVETRQYVNSAAGPDPVTANRLYEMHHGCSSLMYDLQSLLGGGRSQGNSELDGNSSFPDIKAKVVNYVAIVAALNSSLNR
jgi:hypothetical protein